MPNWKKVITSGSDGILNSLNLTSTGSGQTVLDIQGSQGQLFSITDDLTGDIFSISDISGVPIFNINASGATTFDGYVPDNSKLKFGNSGDLEIYHDGSHSRIKDAGTGNLVINASSFVLNNSADSKNMIIATDGGATSLYCNGSLKLATTSTGVAVTGNAAFTGDVQLLTSTGEYSLYGTANGQTALYNNGVKKFETNTTGVTVTGNATLSGFVLDGNTITGIDDSGEFTNNDSHIMTSAAVEDKILGYNYNNYSLPLGTSSARGGFKIGYSENGKNYPVELSSEKMYVNVPWTDTNTNTQLSATEVREAFSAGTNVSISSEGVISSTDTNTNTTYSAGSGLGLSGTTFSHSDTSSQGSSNNSGRTYIQDITLDTYGHVTGLATATETVVNTDTNTQLSTSQVRAKFSAGENVTIEDGVISSTDTNTDTNTVTSIRRDNTGTYRTGNINLVGGTNVSISETSTGVFNISSTDTNTDTNTQNAYSTSVVSSSGIKLRLSGTGAAGNTTDDIKFVGSGATSVARTDASTITISSTDTNTNTTYSAGSGLGLSGTTFSHKDTSSQGSSNNSGRTYIQDITLDTYGHVTGLATATETVVNTNTQLSATEVREAFSAGSNVTIEDGVISSTDTNTDTNTITKVRRDNTGTYRTGNINLVGGTNVSISETSTGVFNISSTDTNTNTTYSAGSGLSLSGTTFSHSDTSSQSSVNGSGRTYIQDITLDTYGHVTGLSTATETVVNTDTNTTTTADVVSALNADLGGNFTIGNQSNDQATFAGGITVGSSVKLTSIERDTEQAGILGYNSDTGIVTYRPDGVFGTGTANKLVKWNSTSGIQNSEITDTGTTIELGNNSSNQSTLYLDTDNRKVGFRTESPGAAFDVNGTIRVRNQLNVGHTSEKNLFVNGNGSAGGHYVQIGDYKVPSASHPNNGNYFGITGAENQPKYSIGVGNGGKIVQDMRIMTVKLSGNAFKNLSTTGTTLIPAPGADYFILPYTVTIHNTGGAKGSWTATDNAAIGFKDTSSGTYPGQFNKLFAINKATLQLNNTAFTITQAINNTGKYFGTNKALMLKASNDLTKEGSTVPAGTWYIQIRYQLVNKTAGIINNVDKTLTGNS